MYTLKVANSGAAGTHLFEGSYDHVMNLAHALENFSNDVMYLRVYDKDYNDMYVWNSPKWND